MNVLGFAWRSLVRQPARSTLGILGVAAVGALLFDMLLLSQGLLLSMRGLLDRMGFDVRVVSSDQFPGPGPDLDDAQTLAAQIAGLPSVRSVVTIRSESADLQRAGGESVRVTFLGVGGSTVRPWTVVSGRDIAADRELVLNAYAAEELDAAPGDAVLVKAFCFPEDTAPPQQTFRIAGIAEFLFDAPDTLGAATTADDLALACAQEAGKADFVAVVSAGDPEAAAAAISAQHPDLRAMTNEQAVGQLQQRGFTYFRQISTVLSTVTVSFALLLITVLLTVSVNQRLGEVAALRAIGFSQRRVVLDVLCESVLIVGIGGGLSLPLGWLLAQWLDGILKRMPNIPVQLHFFVFEPNALAVHALLLGATAILAAVYPMRIVARLPIAATLRNETVS
ncbi:MAG: hypothetical protein A3F70_10640 [Acidobacteria bacterium RIFCSPLOWO2_12_FULL_67_14]|nr:MAG: hypothetical protein A3H29_09565 [Acidobacteria bacterium RIFCSPLOWO2_02_FULL_67_21]OFW35158.1 MAG: hypothetical protein A3F70_10640 [Acidobacteria bacterium RIFCSPLOWO2_12_FULL_67_14]